MRLDRWGDRNNSGTPHSELPERGGRILKTLKLRSVGFFVIACEKDCRATLTFLCFSSTKELYQAPFPEWRQLRTARHSGGLSFLLFLFDGWR